QPARAGELQPGARLEHRAPGAHAHRHPAPGPAGDRDAAPRPGRHLMGLRGTTCLLACLWLSPGPAASAGEPGGDLRQAWRAVDPAALDALRGGLVAPSGLHVSFGFERTVQVNGITVLAQRVQVADVARITPAEADQLATLGQPQVLRIGHFDAAVTPSVG